MFVILSTNYSSIIYHQGEFIMNAVILDPSKPVKHLTIGNCKMTLTFSDEPNYEIVPLIKSALIDSYLQQGGFVPECSN